MGSLRYIFTVVKTPVPCISTSCTLCFYYVTKCAKLERRSCYITIKMTKIIFLSPATTRSETCIIFQVSSAVFVQLFCFALTGEKPLREFLFSDFSENLKDVIILACLDEVQKSRARSYVLAVRAGGGCLDIVFSRLSFISPSLGDGSI